MDIRGASRTDSGAHSLGQIADFESGVSIEPKKWAAILNRLLPIDVRIARSEKVRADFHSRFFARSRTYLYRISEWSRVQPMRSRYVFEGGHSIDISAMRKSAEALLGENDFLAFAEELQNVENTRRNVLRCAIRKTSDEVRIEIEATAFLRGMVRRISGGLFEVGRGHRTVESFGRLLDEAARDDEQWPVVLPARGLTLKKVYYGEPLRDLRTELAEE